jgi:hypothetical protein
MSRGWLRVVALALGIAALHGGESRAQWGYPWGYGNCGWFGWGGETVQGSIARGMGAFAEGVGFYNKSTAIANSIDVDTIMRWNEYLYESQQTANRAYRERQARRQARTIQAQDEIQRRLRDNPEPRDIARGSALNVAMDEINNPAIYAKALEGAKVKVGGDLIRNIPFQYAPAAITTSFHQVTQGPPPAALLKPEYQANLTALKAVGQEIREQVDDGGAPDPRTLGKGRTLVNALESQVQATLPRNTRDRVEADRYLKAVHGLLGMLRTPAIDVLLSGVDKRPEATLADLLTFMNAFNLRFGPANTSQQREIYQTLFTKLDKLRDELAPLVASRSLPKAKGSEPAEFFSAMSYEDLQKEAPPAR